jgi:hypothetical protein
MKVKISVLALMLVLISGLDNSAVLAAATPSFLGKTTWNLYVTEYTLDQGMAGRTLNLTGGITRLGENYYSFQGTMPFVTTAGTSLMVLSGGGSLVDGQLIMSVSESMQFEGAITDRANGVMHFILNQSDLNGTITEVSILRLGTPSHPYLNGYLAGNLTRTGPMIPLTQGVGGPLLLMLE